MSHWRNVTQALHQLGGRASAMTLRRLIDYDPATISRELGRAKDLGLVASDPHGGNNRVWSLTPRGMDWCENRVTQVETRPGGRRWVSTWLASLPRDIRIDQRATQ